MNVVYCAHFSVLCAVDDAPALMPRGIHADLTALAQIIHVLLVDVRMRVRACFALSEHNVRQLGGNVEI